MMILARVNGYYSPFFPSTIAQEEEQAETGHIFNLAEENFFRYRLQTLYPKIDEEGIKSAIEVGKLSLLSTYRRKRV